MKFLILLLLPFIHAFKSCQDTILLTSSIDENLVNSNDHNSRIQHSSVSMINLKSTHEQFCFHDPKQNITFGIKILEEKDICDHFEPLYYVPNDLHLLCELFPKNNWFNSQTEKCQHPSDLDFSENFPSIALYNDAIISKGCTLSTGTFVNAANWWFSVLFNKNKSKLNSYYTVYTCSSSHTKLTLEFNILNGFKPQKTIIELTNSETVLTQLENFNLSMSFISKNDNSINLFNKCFLTDYDNNIAIIDSCNAPGNTILGEVGEIQCSTSDDAITLSRCLHSYNLVPVLNGDKLFCPLNHISMPVIFDHHRLPKKFTGYSVSTHSPSLDNSNSTESKSISSVKIVKDIQNIVLGFKASFIPEQVINTGICNISPVYEPIEVHGISGYYTGSFPLKIQSSSQFIVSFQCDLEMIPIQELLTDISDDYKEYIFHLNPGLSNFITLCQVSCNNHLKFNFKLKGTFVPENITLLNNKFTQISSSNSLETDNTNSFMSSVLDIFSNPFNSIKHIIINSVIYLVLSLICIIVLIKCLPETFLYILKKTLCNKNKTNNSKQPEDMPLTEISTTTLIPTHYPPPTPYSHNPTAPVLELQSISETHSSYQKFIPDISIPYPTIVLVSPNKYEILSIIFNDNFYLLKNKIYFQNKPILSNISFLLILQNEVTLNEDNDWYKIQHIQPNHKKETIIKYSKSDLQTPIISSLYSTQENYIIQNKTKKSLLYVSSSVNPIKIIDTNNFYKFNNSLYFLQTKKPAIINIFLKSN